jgi:hypothetical protein
MSSSVAHPGNRSTAAPHKEALRPKVIEAFPASPSVSQSPIGHIIVEPLDWPGILGEG